jgi:ketosteroid isomerase-like protein
MVPTWPKLVTAPATAIDEYEWIRHPRTESEVATMTTTTPGCGHWVQQERPRGQRADHPVLHPRSAGAALAGLRDRRRARHENGDTMTHTQTATTDTGALRALAEHWCDAERRGDAATLAPLLADDFVAVGPLGFLLTKDQWLGRYRSGDLANESFDWDEGQVRVYGDAAIVIGTQTSKSTYKGQPAGGRFRVTQVALRRGHGWILAGLQLSGTPETSEQ